MRSFRLALAAFAVAAIPAVVAIAPAHAEGDYPLRSGTMRTFDTAGSAAGAFLPGQSVTVRGGGFAPGTEVRIAARGVSGVLVTVRADATGNIAATVPVSGALATPGSHVLTATGAGPKDGQVLLETTIRVAGAPRAAVSPAEESSQAPLMLGLGGMVALASGAIVVRRLRGRL